MNPLQSRKNIGILKETGESAVIQLEKVSRLYRKNGQDVWALRDLDLHVAPGEFVALVGRSGSGKTTLMNILGCLDRPTSGTYRLEGRPVTHLGSRAAARARNRTIGFIFQGFRLVPDMTALENAALPLLLRGVSRREREARARLALEQVGLGDRLAHRPAELSGGQQQRVAIARVMAARTPLILADEPTGSLDQGSGLEIMALLEDLNQKGAALVLITHDRALAQRAPRILTMEQGSLH